MLIENTTFKLTIFLGLLMNNHEDPLPEAQMLEITLGTTTKL